jgi:hypothetical protein
MTTGYVQMLARTAYLWGWPLVNMANRAAAFAKAPEPGLLGGIIPVAYNRIAMLTGYISPDQYFITCPNQDVAYGASPPRQWQRAQSKKAYYRSGPFMFSGRYK